VLARRTLKLHQPFASLRYTTTSTKHNTTHDIQATHIAMADFNVNNINGWTRAEHEAYESALTLDLVDELSEVPTDLDEKFSERHEMRMANMTQQRRKAAEPKVKQESQDSQPNIIGPRTAGRTFWESVTGEFVGDDDAAEAPDLGLGDDDIMMGDADPRPSRRLSATIEDVDLEAPPGGAADEDMPDASVTDDIQDPASPVRESAPARGRGRPRKVAGPNKLYPVDAVPTRVLGINGTSWLPLSSLATATRSEMDAFNEDAATGSSSWDEYARMVNRGDDEVDHRNPACIYCLVRTKKRSKCNVDETGKASCSNCINNGVPCCRLVHDADGDIVVGFVPLPANHREGKAWREIGYYRLSSDQVRTKPAGKVTIKDFGRSKAAKAKASAPSANEDRSSRTTTRTEQRTKSRQDTTAA